MHVRVIFPIWTYVDVSSLFSGLKGRQAAFLNSLPYVHGMLTLNTTKSYFPNQACRFKPLMILEFIELYQKMHSCRFFFYGDAVSVIFYYLI